MVPPPPQQSGGAPSSSTAPQASITEIPIPSSLGNAVSGIALAPDTSVYVSLGNSNADIGARYANGIFTAIPYFDAQVEGFPFGAVAAATSNAAFFAMQTFRSPQSATAASGIQEYYSGKTDLVGGGTPFTTIPDVVADASGNIWYGISGDYTPIAVKQSATVPPGSEYAYVHLPGDYTVNVLAVAAGPDGDGWFALSDGHIDRLSPAGALLHEYATPPGTLVNGMAVATDNTLWFTDSGHNAIGKLAGTTFSSYPIPSAASGVARITRGGDGAMWFTERSANKIGRIAAGGSIVEYAVPTANAGPAGIAGPNGGACSPSIIWFVEVNAGKIGEITIKGV
ncbi:MAG TPA: hypothetical protein VIG51_07185 [Candidatus Baltobacteraceae bacterium]|jgi:hypothetical protein